jgi:hypothetical protein
VQHGHDQLRARFAGAEAETACTQHPARVVKRLLKAIVREALERADDAPNRVKSKRAAKDSPAGLLGGQMASNCYCPSVLAPHVGDMVLHGMEYKCGRTDKWQHNRYTTQYFLRQVHLFARCARSLTRLPPLRRAREPTTQRRTRSSPGW